VILHKIRIFFSLGKQEKKLFCQAFILLGIIRVKMLTQPFKHLTRSLEHQKSISKIDRLDPEEIRIALLVGIAVNRAAKYTPWKSACLVQALTTHRILVKYNLPGVIYLGIAKKAENEIIAHAWTQCGDKILTGAKGHEPYTTISVFIWKRRDTKYLELV